MAAKLSATSREREEYASATQAARKTRERVADQVRELIVEGDRMGGRAEVASRIGYLLEAERRIAEAIGRQRQAAENGMPQQPHRHDELEAREALRSAVMSLSVACGAWAAGMDHAGVASHVSAPSDEPPAL